MWPPSTQYYQNVVHSLFSESVKDQLSKQMRFKVVGGVCYLVYELQQGSSVVFPVGGQLGGLGVLDTAQLDGHLKTVGVQVVPVLHATWTGQNSSLGFQYKETIMSIDFWYQYQQKA